MSPFVKANNTYISRFAAPIFRVHMEVASIGRVSTLWDTTLEELLVFKSEHGSSDFSDNIEIVLQVIEEVTERLLCLLCFDFIVFHINKCEFSIHSNMIKFFVRNDEYYAFFL